MPAVNVLNAAGFVATRRGATADREARYKKDISSGKQYICLIPCKIDSIRTRLRFGLVEGVNCSGNQGQSTENGGMFIRAPRKLCTTSSTLSSTK